MSREQKKRRFNAVLIYIGLFALAFRLWYEQPDEHTTRAAQRPAPADIRHFSLLRQNRPDVQFVREPSSARWRLLHPVHAPASDGAVRDLLAILNAPYRDCQGFDEALAQSLGLQPAQATLRFEHLDIPVGYTDPLSGGIFARIHEEICRVDWLGAPNFNADSGQFVDLHWLPDDSQMQALYVNKTPRRFSQVDWEYGQAQGVQHAGDTNGGQSVRLLTDQGEQRFTLVRRGRDWALQPYKADYELLMDADTAITLGLLES